MAEGSRRHPVDQQLGTGGELRQVDQIAGREDRVEFGREGGRILRADAEGDQTADIAKDRLADAVIKLVQKLVGNRQADAELAPLAEHGRQHAAWRNSAPRRYRGRTRAAVTPAVRRAGKPLEGRCSAPASR